MSISSGGPTDNLTSGSNFGFFSGGSGVGEVDFRFV